MSEQTNNQDDYNELDDYFSGTRMSFGDHLLELRERIIKSLTGLAVGFGVSLFFGKYVLFFVATPMLMALAAKGLEPTLYFNSPAEYFLTYIKVSLVCGIFISAPWIFYQLWGFIAAGLYDHERRFVNLFAPFSAALFMLGGLFFVTVVAPISFNFFVTFGSKWTTPDFEDNFFYRRFLSDPKVKVSPKDKTEQGKETIPPLFGVSLEFFVSGGRIWVAPQVSYGADQDAVSKDEAAPRASPASKKQSLVKPWITLQAYIQFVIWLTLVFGLAFQMPLLVFMVARLGLVTLATLRSVRKYIIFVILIASAVITPPDVVSQVMLSIPMYALYELGILMAQFWPRRR